MQNILVKRYPRGEIDGVPLMGNFWQGCIEPEDHSWIAFIDREGRPVFFLNRDPETGAVLEDEPAEVSPGADPSGVKTGQICP